ncbi:MAG: HAD family hydrolase [Candidatus Rokuibacteriota bacterium]
MVACAHERVKHPVRAVIFDYGGVLRRDDRETYDAVARALVLPRDSLWSAIHDIPEYRRSREGAIDRATFRAAVRRALTLIVGGGRAEAALAALEQHVADLPPVEPEMRALLERLRGEGRVRLGLLSNGPLGWSQRLGQLGVTQLFDTVIVSADAGLAKPDPAVFRLAAERLGVEPAACLMIDDQPGHLPGAEAAGLRTHLFAHTHHTDLVARLVAEGALGRGTT